MDIKNAFLKQEVYSPHFNFKGRITNFRMSDSGLNRVYVTVENEEQVRDIPLDMVMALD